MRKIHPIRSLLCCAIAVALVSGVRAQSVPVPGVRQTTLSLEFNLPESNKLAPSHVTVPAGEFVVVQGTPASGAVASLQWLKNGQPLPDELGTSLLFPSVTPADAGTYAARLTLVNGTIVTSQSLILGVGPAERLVNLSTFTSLPDGLGQGVIAGFVVTGAKDKKMIVRAVGPSLAQFGFARVLKQPVLRIRDAKGRLYENAYVYPAVQGGLTYEKDLADSLAKVGAFTTPAGSADAVRLLPVAPGSYTVEVTSADATAGAVLLEIYEVP